MILNAWSPTCYKIHCTSYFLFLIRTNCHVNDVSSMYSAIDYKSDVVCHAVTIYFHNVKLINLRKSTKSKINY